MLIPNPPTTSVDTQGADGTLQPPAFEWRAFFVSIANTCNALTRSGTTAQRPVKLIWVGLTFFDTTLGIPIWLKSVRPNVWINSAGAAV